MFIKNNNTFKDKDSFIKLAGIHKKAKRNFSKITNTWKGEEEVPVINGWFYTLEQYGTFPSNIQVIVGRSGTWTPPEDGDYDFWICGGCIPNGSAIGVSAYALSATSICPWYGFTTSDVFTINHIGGYDGGTPLGGLDDNSRIILPNSVGATFGDFNSGAGSNIDLTNGVIDSGIGINPSSSLGPDLTSYGITSRQYGTMGENHTFSGVGFVFFYKVS